jgi:hypothetical protein
VPVNDLETAKTIFNSRKGLLESADDVEHNIYTEYKRGFPRFRFCSEPGFHVVLFTDTYFHLEPLRKHVVFRDEHQYMAEYSQEVLDSISADQVAALPFPRFEPFFKGLCRTYTKTLEVTAAIAAEFLVDGMDIDEEWCYAHISTSEIDELNFALRLVRGKGSRIADFSSNEITCFIPDYQKAQRVRKIPGFPDRVWPHMDRTCGEHGAFDIRI